MQNQVMFSLQTAQPPQDVRAHNMPNGCQTAYAMCGHKAKAAPMSATIDYTDPNWFGKYRDFLTFTRSTRTGKRYSQARIRAKLKLALANERGFWREVKRTKAAKCR
jgi:hypothetical protein